MKRDDLCEISKAVGSLFIIYMHIGSVIGKEIFLLFTVQIFFVISGILSSKSKWYNSAPNFRAFLRCKCSSLIVPYYIWGTIDLVIYLFFSSGSKEILAQLLCFLFGMRRITGELCFTGAIWFLTALFSSQLLFYLFVNYLISNKVKVSFILIVFITAVLFKNNKMILPFNLDTVPYILPTIIVGYYFGKSGYYDTYKTQPSRVWLIPVSGLILAFSYKVLKQTSDIFYRDFNNLLLFWLCGFAGTVGVFEISKIILSCKISLFQNFFHFVGRSSLEYMAIHQQMVIYPLNQAGLIISNRFINISVKYPIALILTSLLTYVFVKLKENLKS